MKVKVKTLRGIQFEVEAKLEDTVADLKKNIETVKGADVYPAARQMLIYREKVLKDDTTLQEYEVVDSDFMIIMLSPLNRVAPPPPPPPSSTTNPDIPSDNLDDDQEASRLAEGINLLAVTEAPPPPPAVTPRQATQPPPPADPPTGPNANPFPKDPRPGAEYGIYDEMSPEELYGFRQAAWASSPDLWPITREDDAALERLEALGFSKLMVWQAYLACNKNEELAANYLLEHMPPDSDE